MTQLAASPASFGSDTRCGQVDRKLSQPRLLPSVTRWGNLLERSEEQHRSRREREHRLRSVFREIYLVSIHTSSRTHLQHHRQHVKLGWGNEMRLVCLVESVLEECFLPAIAISWAFPALPHRACFTAKPPSILFSPLELQPKLYVRTTGGFSKCWVSGCAGQIWRPRGCYEVATLITRRFQNWMLLGHNARNRQQCLEPRFQLLSFRNLVVGERSERFQRFTLPSCLRNHKTLARSDFLGISRSVKVLSQISYWI